MHVVELIQKNIYDYLRILRNPSMAANKYEYNRICKIIMDLYTLSPEPIVTESDPSSIFNHLEFSGFNEYYLRLFGFYISRKDYAIAKERFSHQLEIEKENLKRRNRK